MRFDVARVPSSSPSVTISIPAGWRRSTRPPTEDHDHHQISGGRRHSLRPRPVAVQGLRAALRQRRRPQQSGLAAEAQRVDLELPLVAMGCDGGRRKSVDGQSTRSQALSTFSIQPELR